MAANETVCGASDTPRMTPVSCTGKNPLGTMIYNQTVAASVADRHQQRARLVTEHPAQRRAVALNHRDQTQLRRRDRTSPASPLRPRWRSSLAHIIGVSVSDTTAETRIVTLSVIANSRNRRPTMSPMNSSGISTAIRETVRRKNREADLFGTLADAACRGDSPCFDVAGDVFDHDDRIVHHKAG